MLRCHDFNFYLFRKKCVTQKYIHSFGSKRTLVHTCKMLHHFKCIKVTRRLMDIFNIYIQSHQHCSSYAVALDKYFFQHLSDPKLLPSLFVYFCCCCQTGPFTVFVPTDKAFRALLVQLGGPDRAEDKFRENPRLLIGVII